MSTVQQKSVKAIFCKVVRAVADSKSLFIGRSLFLLLLVRLHCSKSLFSKIGMATPLSGSSRNVQAPNAEYTAGRPTDAQPQIRSCEPRFLGNFHSRSRGPRAEKIPLAARLCGTQTEGPFVPKPIGQNLFVVIVQIRSSKSAREGMERAESRTEELKK